MFCKTCDIRSCNYDNNTINCGKCNNYPCEKINKLSNESIKILDIYKGK